MKILQVIPSLAAGFGGPKNAVLGLSSALVREGQDVTIYTTDADVKGRLEVPLETPVEIQNIKTVYFPVQYIRHYKFSLPLARALRRNIPCFDIVHIHSLFQFSTLAAAYYCRKYHKPYLIRPLGQLDPFLLKRHFLYKKPYLYLFERRNLDGAAAIHFTSEEEKRLAKDLGLRSRSVVVGLGLDLNEFNDLPEYGTFRRNYPELKNKKIILFLSRVNFKKGLDILVKAFANIARKRKDVSLVIAGPDNEGYGKKVKQWLNKEGVSNLALFTGMLLGKDKLAAFRDSDVFVLPSYSENFGLAVIEAMACGLPVVISSKINISVDIMKAGAGLIVDTDYLQLSGALERLLDESQLRKEIISKAEQLIRLKFSWFNIARDMVKIYQSIKDNKNG